jgi:hypothetical protein
MRILIVAASAMALTACGLNAVEPSQRAAEQNGCPAAASGAWEGHQIEAWAHGADCVEAEATITIRNSAGDTAFSATHVASHVFTLAGAETVDDMQRRLNEWISPPGAARDSTGDLPEWPAGADSPAAGEFPFYVEEGVERTTYETLRARDAPMYCYVQGLESLACFALEDARLTKIGVQSFPG